MNFFLEIGFRFFAARFEPFGPEEECLPMDTKDDLECQEGVFEGKMQKGGIAERYPLPHEGADEFATAATVVINQDLQVFVRRIKEKVKFEIKIGKGRDIEVFHYTAAEAAVGGEGNEIGLPFAESIADFRNGGQGVPL